MIEEVTFMIVLTEDVGFLLARASGLVIRATNGGLVDVGLRARPYSVLALACDSAEGISQRDLAEVLGLDPSQVVALVDDLVADGLVERQPSPRDRRAKLVVPTPVGSQRCEAASATVERALETALAPLSIAERDHLRDMLIRVLAPVL